MHDGPNPYVIFGVLLGALLLSLGLAAVSTGPLVIAVIFLVAAVKAYLVLAYFIHLRVEPRFVKLLVAGVLCVLAILYLALVPDIVWVYGRVGGS